MLEPYVSKGNRASVAACRSAEMNVLFRRFSRRLTGFGSVDRTVFVRV
jgi:hypothetical protein